MTKKFLVVYFILTCSVFLSLSPAYAQDLYVIYNTIYGTTLTSDQELEDTYGLACSDTCESCMLDSDCLTGTCDPIDDEVWIETNGWVVATARFAGYTQSFGYYTDACVGNDQAELFNVTTTGYLTECSPASQNPGDSCIEDNDCPDGTCVSPYNNIFFTGGGTEIFGFYDDPSGSPQWFSQPLLNVDGNNDHMVTYRAADFNPLAPEYIIAWEDLNLGDADYNDLVVVLQHQEPCLTVECCVVDGDCDDFDNCTVDTCVDSVCQNTPIDCSSLDDQCNIGVCDPGTGSCVQDPTPKNGDSCDDGDACTTADTCAGGACVGGLALDCDDGNVCTDDSCNPASGCVNTNNTAPCDDGDACTTSDTCAGGACVGGAAPDCDDANLCTDDSCNPASGCVNTNNTAPCDDGDACTTADTCAGGACVGGAALDCDDGNLCTDDSCNPASGCFNTNNTSPCDDGDACTTADTCAGGACVGGSAPNCDDGNVCTDDSCNPASGCVNTNNTAPCDDGDACTTADTCAGGSCVGGSAPNCDDGNVCTDDSCNPASGCVNTNNTAPCDDGDACTTSDTCDSGTCNGSPKDCSSLDDQCNEGICDPGTGNCFQDPVPKFGDPCDDGIPCTVNDTCDDGTCSGSPADCSSLSDQCNVGTCDPGTGNCFQDPVPRNGNPCDDGDPNTENDSCSDGVCLGGPGAASAIPTLSEWGMIIFMTLILGLGVITILRRREEQKSSIR